MVAARTGRDCPQYTDLAAARLLAPMLAYTGDREADEPQPADDVGQPNEDQSHVVEKEILHVYRVRLCAHFRRLQAASMV